MSIMAPPKTALTTPYQPLSLPQLSAYISQNIPQITLPLQSIQQFTRGQSNPTYLLTDASAQRYVLRKKPPGGSILSQTAHDVEREYEIMSALGAGKTEVPVPEMYGLCKDESVLGEVFYIMAFVDGRVFDDWRFMTVGGEDARLRREMWRSAMHTLAAIHAVPLSTLPAAMTSRRRRRRPTPTHTQTRQVEDENFYTRQLRTLSLISTKQAQTINLTTKQRTPSIPHLDRSLARLSHHLHHLLSDRTRTRSCLIHNDYKINNLMYAHSNHASSSSSSSSSIIAVLDWELATLGNPLADLANLLAPFIAPPGQEKDPNPEEPGVGAGFAEGLGGGRLLQLSRAECLDWYAERSGWRPTRAEMLFADAFSALRNSVIVQGIVARRALGQAKVVDGGGGGEGAGEGAGQEIGGRGGGMMDLDFRRLIGEFGEFAWGLVGVLEDLRGDEGEGEEGVEPGRRRRKKGLERL
ncbi:MAG: hypothetical protein M1816_006119 [Peltula sp. TS41687]|nr:MAG: hypothetical protein M1816_006119 [Peltula sp. TS41687]